MSTESSEVVGRLGQGRVEGFGCRWRQFRYCPGGPVGASLGDPVDQRRERMRADRRPRQEAQDPAGCCNESAAVAVNDGNGAWSFEEYDVPWLGSGSAAVD